MARGHSVAAVLVVLREARQEAFWVDYWEARREAVQADLAGSVVVANRASPVQNLH